jgi:GTA TIM-barrel-like domain
VTHGLCQWRQPPPFDWRVYLRHDGSPRSATCLPGTPVGAHKHYYDTFNGGAFPKTDYAYSIDQLQAAFPSCTTVAVVCAWFGSSENAAACQIYPSTTYIGGSFTKWNGSSYVTDHWMVSSLTETSSGLIPISSSGGSFTYGGTPSDQSIVECIVDLKARGLRVVFYPFILMDSPGKPWRGRITYSPDVSSVATSAVAAFLGSANTSQFTRLSNTVSYAGSPTDFTYRRMVLHYANLCIVAGGVDVFLIGSEFRGLETIRGPGWTITGTTDGGGKAIWDYPFVAGMITLADDVRGVFDAAGFTKDLTGLHNLISYAADWSDWMGWQHPGASPALPVADGQWPHLDQLWAHANIDLVCFDNYMPLSDWTTGDGRPLPSGQSNNLDVANWSAPAAVDSAFDYERVTQSVVSTADYGAASSVVSSSLDYGIVSAAALWPPSPPPASPNFNGLGLAGQPTINSKSYLKANIEGGERFNWFYFDSNNLAWPRSERFRSASVASGRRPPKPIAEPIFCEPADSRQQAAPMVVEQHAQSPLRRGIRRGSARAGHAMDRAIKTNRLRRIRFPGM